MEDKLRSQTSMSNSNSSLEQRKVRYLSWGIFTVAHDVEDRFVSSPRIWLSSLKSFNDPLRCFVRFVIDLWRIAPWQSLEYYSHIMWMVISPVLSSYLGYLVLHRIDAAIRNPAGMQKNELKPIQMLSLMWLTCGLLTHYVANMLQYESRVKLGPHLRVHFLPQLVQASLARDQVDMKDLGSFPSAYDYGDFIPGWEPFCAIFTRLRHILAVVVEILVMVYIILHQEDAQSQIFSFLIVAFVLVNFLSPIDAVGGKGYSFWTKNNNYNRLMTLYNIVFDFQYRKTLIKDGQTQCLAQEYKRVSDSLGPVKADTYMLGWCLYPAWHWGIVRFWIANSPMALIALTLPWISSTSPIFVMAIVQYSIFTMQHSIDYLRNTDESFWGLTTRIMAFYDVIDRPPCVEDWSSTLESNDEQKKSISTKISLQNVSHQILEDISLDIIPGHLIIITGPNGSGKSTLAKIISGMASPTSGWVLVDDQPPSQALSNDGLSIRTLYLERSEAIYPVSLEENISMSVFNGEAADKDSLGEALRLGRSHDIVQKLGLQTVLNPCSIPACSIVREVGPGARKALRKNCPDPHPIDIPEDHRQHMIASRAFFRLKTRDTGLIILDEATNAMDPAEENHILNNFRQISREKGQTMIVVTHNLSSIAEHADDIFYLERGKVVEQGTHAQLMDMNGAYCSIYKATGQ
ncbi:hypothetical protein HYPSUDRAFT_534231 [Hypholoma sublateritium FD-334 SS-4]|uniref:ABC transporter domain-containing protein n=1 Tax=Hypholoma sublateritium (strain FD-334 SS-4) TaxID=945553 RepID=A0A0D2P683_HYPSF|nr:hypothetical protein HYPSUDRAFT_534231 [Hypholoma sublateritium FD-334 SS-4]